MRSFSFTLLLLLFTALMVGLAVVRIADGSLARVFGSPPTPIGAALYEFDPGSIRKIELGGNGISADCVLTATGWQIKSPWNDRMDPRIAQALIDFTLNTRVEGAIPADKVESKALGFETGRVGMRLSTDQGQAFATFILGHRTVWVSTDPETAESIPTVFIEPHDENRKHFIYACTDAQDIHSVLKNGFGRLRDHHPFLFHPTIVQSLRIKNRNGEMLLSRNGPKELWQITKPLELKSDRAALIRLVQGLYDLEAISVISRSEVTLPAADTSNVDQIAIRFFQPEGTPAAETILHIYPPETPESISVLATISDRPDTVFELPLTAQPSAYKEDNLVGLADLPLSVNDLRDPTLTAIDVSQLRNIVISSAAADSITIKREKPSDHFKILINGELEAPNETALFALLKTITKAKVSEFISDTATDLSTYGLDQPFLSLAFRSFGDSMIRLDFAQAKDGSILAIRHGTTTVVKIDPAMLAMIPTKIWNWMDTTLWHFADPDLVGIIRQIKDQPALELGYNFITQRWTARQQGKDLSAELAIDRANLLLLKLTELKASVWLPPGQTAAAEALANPDMSFTLLIKTYDEQGEFSGLEERTLRIATIAQGQGRISYGQLSGEPYLFLLNPDILKPLGVDLFSFE